MSSQYDCIYIAVKRISIMNEQMQIQVAKFQEKMQDDKRRLATAMRRLEGTLSILRSDYVRAGSPGFELGRVDALSKALEEYQS